LKPGLARFFFATIEITDFYVNDDSGFLMDSFGYKIIDRQSEVVDSILSAVTAEHRPLEIGLYGSDDGFEEYLKRTLPVADYIICSHFDHRRVNLYKSRENEAVLREQIERSIAFGARYGIIHVAAYPMALRPAYQDLILERLDALLVFLNDVASEYDFPIHIENTFHDLNFYQRLFASVSQSGFDYLHFCFDLGHAKVWSTASLDNWVEFMRSLEVQGKAIHIHLHANSGVFDEHMAFSDADQAGYTLGDEFTGGKDLFAALADLHGHLPQVVKIFEVPPDKTIKNMAYFMERIGEYRYPVT
jgi:hypothetical protein